MPSLTIENKSYSHSSLCKNSWHRIRLTLYKRQVTSINDKTEESNTSGTNSLDSSFSKYYRAIFPPDEKNVTRIANLQKCAILLTMKFTQRAPICLLSKLYSVYSATGTGVNYSIPFIPKAYRPKRSQRILYPSIPITTTPI